MEAVKIDIPDDNSCLFNAIYYLIQKEEPNELRQIVSSIILSNPEKYNALYLNMEPMEYVRNIMDPTQWGGAIELQILSEYYKTEICAFSIETGIPFLYGEGNDFRERIYIVYNGVHYDALVIAFDGGIKEVDNIKIFSSQDLDYFEDFKKLIEKYKKKGMYYNPNQIQVLCKTCQIVMISQKEIQNHAIQTKHNNFVQI